MCYFITVMREQGFVRGHDMSTVLQGGRDNLPRDPIAAADQLDHDVDAGRASHFHRIVMPGHATNIDGAAAGAVAGRHRNDLDFAPGMVLDLACVAAEQRNRPRPDCA